MEYYFLKVLSGQLISAQHIVLFDIQDPGSEDQRRSEVQVTLVTGDRQALQTFKGTDAHRAAQQYLADLLEQLGARQLRPRSAVTS